MHYCTCWFLGRWVQRSWSGSPGSRCTVGGCGLSRAPPSFLLEPAPPNCRSANWCVCVCVCVCERSYSYACEMHHMILKSYTAHTHSHTPLLEQQLWSSDDVIPVEVNGVR